MKHRHVLAGTSTLLIAIGLLLPGGASEAHVGAGIPLMITNNSLHANAILKNALTVNRISLKQLTTHKLASDTFTDSTLQLGTVLGIDDKAREVMHYIVGCALRKCDGGACDPAVQWGTETWVGDVGLCPEWATGQASEACQERVSACVLARNNARGLVVPLSLRGEFDDGSEFWYSYSTEDEDYDFREGAFFGNMFDPDSLNPSTEVVVDLTTNPPQLKPPSTSGVSLQYKAPGKMQAVYMNMFACGSSDFASPHELMLGRICASSDGTDSGSFGCAARYVGPCRPLAGSPGACATDNRVGGEGDYEGCGSPGISGNDSPRVWSRPVTTFLHKSCDTVPSDQLDPNGVPLCNPSP